MTEKDGGPAFPTEGTFHRKPDGGYSMWTPQQGMSLRDYFAAAALPGLFHTVGKFDHVPADTIPVALADAAYDIADEMLKRRSGR